MTRALYCRRQIYVGTTDVVQSLGQNTDCGRYAVRKKYECRAMESASKLPRYESQEIDAHNTSSFLGSGGHGKRAGSTKSNIAQTYLPFAKLAHSAIERSKSGIQPMNKYKTPESNNVKSGLGSTLTGPQHTLAGHLHLMRATAAPCGPQRLKPLRFLCRTKSRKPS